MNINLNLYKYFYEVAKVKSFTVAANNLYISQPSLSYSVKTLEEQLNVQLLKRLNNRVEFTEEGEKLFNQLAPLFEAFEKLEINPKEKKKVIKIGVRSAFGSYILPEYIYEFSKIYPDILIEYYIYKSDEMYTKVKSGELDFIIDEKLYDDLCGKLVTIDDQTVFFSSINNPITFIDKDSSNLPTILAVKSNNFTSSLLKEHPNLKIEYILKSPLMIYNVMKSDYVGFTSKKLIVDELAINKVKIVNTNIDLPKPNVYIMGTNNEKLNSDEFVKYMTDNI